PDADVACSGNPGPFGTAGLKKDFPTLSVAGRPPSDNHVSPRNVPETALDGDLASGTPETRNTAAAADGYITSISAAGCPSRDRYGASGAVGGAACNGHRTWRSQGYVRYGSSNDRYGASSCSAASTVAPCHSPPTGTRAGRSRSRSPSFNTNSPGNNRRAGPVGVYGKTVPISRQGLIQR